MTGTIAWIALLVAALVAELLSRRESHRVSSLCEIGARIATHVLGRALLWLMWIFIGVHLFARYGVHR